MPRSKAAEGPDEILATLAREVDAHVHAVFAGVVLGDHRRNLDVDADADIDHTTGLDAEILDERTPPIFGHDEDLRHVLEDAVLVAERPPGVRQIAFGEEGTLHHAGDVAVVIGVGRDSPGRGAARTPSGR